MIITIVILSAILLPLKQPLILLTISAVLGGIIMSIYIPILIYMNNFRLQKPLRPGWFVNLFMIAAGIFYAYFSIRIILVYLF